ncbi:arginine-tRNA-protein transferase [Entophlyctis helioformis]|nr:arginine-tRNA-protein transferase [Entophlyctis helioformis]
MSHNESPMSIVAITGESQSSCGYCHSASKISSKSFGMWAYSLTADIYQALIDRGWRRSGQYLYKPTLSKTCCPAYTIRLDTTAFECSKGQKKVLKKMRRFLSDGGRSGGASTVTAAGASADAQTGHDSMNGDDGADSAGVPPTERYMGPAEGMPAISMADISATAGASAAIETTKAATAPGVSAGSSAATTLAAASAPAAKPKHAQMQRNQSIVDLVHQAENPEESDLAAASKVGKVGKAGKAGKVGKQKHQLKVVLEPAAFTQETFDLYCKYQIAIHKDPPSRLSKSQFVEFLVDSPIHCEAFPDGVETDICQGYGSYHQKYYMDGTLIAVAVLDILPACVSAVYFMYDPDYSFLSLGSYSALRETALAASLSRVLPDLCYYYMGYYIHSCTKMRYKAQFRPSFLLCPQTYQWVRFASIERLLDACPATSLAASAPPDGADSNPTDARPLTEPRPLVFVDASDVVSEREIANVIVLHDRRLHRLVRYTRHNSIAASIKTLWMYAGEKVMETLIVAAV